VDQRTSLDTKFPLPSQSDVSHEPQEYNEGNINDDKTQVLTLDFDKLSISPGSKEGEIATEKNETQLSLKKTCLSETPNAKVMLCAPGNEMELDLILCKKNLFGELNETSTKENWRIGDEVNFVDMRMQNHSYSIKNSEKDSGMLSKDKGILIDGHNLNSKEPNPLEDSESIEKGCVSQPDSSEDILADLVKKLHIDSNDNKNYSTADIRSISEATSSASAKSERGFEGSQSSSVFTSPGERQPCDGTSSLDPTHGSQVDGISSSVSKEYKPSYEEKQMMLFIDG
jgi:ABC-type antimicrobial peptide transport system permease subunit